MRAALGAVVAALLSGGTGAGAGTVAAVSVRTSPVLLPCAEAAARAFERQSTAARVVVTAGEIWPSTSGDVVVGSAGAMTRVVESGQGDEKSQIDLPPVPWVLVLAAGASPGPGEARSLADLDPSAEVWVLGGVDGREAAHAVQGRAHARVTVDLERLASAPIALVPASLADGRRRAPVDVPPLRPSAVVRRGALRPAAAAAFVAFLARHDGQEAFASCAAAAR